MDSQIKPMRKLHLLLLSLALNLNAFGQSEVLVRILPGKIDSKIELITPIENGRYLYEKYIYFKYAFWARNPDTLTQKSDSVYSSDSLTIEINSDFVLKDPCDSLINRIRNSILSAWTSSGIADSARFHIGYDNAEFIKTRWANMSTTTDEHSLCHEDFKKLNAQWSEQQLNLIASIKAEKKKRYEWMKESDSISTDFIHKFLWDFGSCELDYLTLNEVITKNTDGFLTACKYMDDHHFFWVKSKISDFPESIKTDLLISSLKNSKIRTPRKNKLIRKLKKSTSNTKT